MDTAPPTDLRVGAYELLAKLGEGGMGVVYLARRPGGDRVALKVLRPHVVGDQEARARLAREVASLRRVRSARVAEVVDADPWGETPYVVTRYVLGPSLDHQVRRCGPLRGAELDWFAAGLAEAVLAVHAAGVLHRDVKPANVLLEARCPVLIDFGLARLAEDPRITGAGWLLGTPGYLAPEILYGEDATSASDVHSWAATVAFAATGRPPYGIGPPMAIMDRVRRGEHDLSGVPDALRALLKRALAPEREDRPGVPALVAALAAAASQGPATSAGDRTTRLAVVSRGADDLTDLIAVTTSTSAAGQAPSTMPLTPRTARSLIPPPPTGAPAATPGAGAPAAAPHVWTPPDQPHRDADQPHRDADQPRPQPDADQPPSARSARSQRGLLTLGMFASVAVGFARAPYLSLVVLFMLILAVHTGSRVGQAARERQHRRGRGRWYDGPLSALTVPWYLLVAAGGTLALLVWSAWLALVVGLVLPLFGLPLVPTLLGMGAVLAVSLWLGPGSRRLRSPARRLVRTATRSSWGGWLLAGALAAVIALTAYSLLSTGVDWQPRPGPPWREGTLIGDLVHQARSLRAGNPGAGNSR